MNADTYPRCPKCRRWMCVVYRNGNLYCTKCKIEWLASAGTNQQR